jgi:hypothetical protein
LHSADVEKSARLKRTLEVLQSFPEGATTWDIQCLTSSMAPATDISELRQNGYDVICQYEGKTSTNRRIFRYRLNGRKES